MINERQYQIIKILENDKVNYISSNYFANKFNISVRTVQTDIKTIKKFFDEEKFAALNSISSKGSRMEIIDSFQYQAFLSEFQKKLENKQSDRVQEVCMILLNLRESITKIKLANQLHISSSTLELGIKEATILFSEYGIKIEAKRNKGLIVTGREFDKRRCLLKLGLLELNHATDESVEEPVDRNEIEKILVSTLLKNQYHVSETLFQNLVVHVEMAIHRMKNGFSIQDNELGNVSILEQGTKVSKIIFDQLRKLYFFNFNRAEMINLAVYIQGKSDYERDDYISEEVNSFILKSLNEINEKFNIDLSQEIDLRISLALHIMPLLTRIKYNIQNKNHLLDEIKLSFPLAFDIAAFMSLRLQEKTGIKIQEGEIAYLAIYFNQFLTKYNDISGKKRVLILTSLKRSESILLRQRFATWFPNEISILTLAYNNELEMIDYDNYDVLFTTEQTSMTDSLGAIAINYYPKNSEYSRIKLAIDGFKDNLEILDLFSPKLFVYEKIESKEMVLDRICEESKFIVRGQTSKLKSAVLQREELGSSYFGNRIAMPHPINPIMAKTFVSVLLLKNDLDWDEDGNTVRLVMLVSIEKNNAKVFQLWNYLGAIIQDKKFVDKLLKEPTFDNFKKNLIQVLDGYL